MADNVNEDVKIGVSLVPVKVKETAQKLKKQVEDILQSGGNKSSKMTSLEMSLKQSSQKADELLNKMKSMEGTKVPTEEYTKLQSELDKAVEENTKLADSFDATNKKADELEAELARMENVKVPTDEYSELQKYIEKTENAQIKLEERMERFLATGGSKKSKSYKGMSYDLENLENTLANAKGELQDLVDTGKAFKLGSETDEYKQVEQELNNVIGELNTILEQQTQSQNNIDNIEDKIKSLEGEAGTQFKTTQYSALSDDYNKAVEEYEKLGNEFDKAQAKADELEAKLKELDSVETPTAEIEQEYEATDKELDKVLNDMSQILEKQKAAEANIDSIEAKLRQMESTGNAYKTATGGAFTSGETTAEYQKLEQQLDGVCDKIKLTTQKWYELKNVQDKPGSTEGVSKTKAKVDQLAKSVKKTTSNVKQLHSASNKGFSAASKSLSGLIKKIAKYAVGISTLYVLFSKLRSWGKEGLDSLAKQSSEVNSQLSQLLTSFNRLKASIGAAFQPILTVVTPILDALINKIADVMEAIAKLIAMLTGQSYIYKAVAVQQDYAASLDSTADSAEEATKKLATYDTLVVIDQDTGSSGSGSSTPELATFEKEAVGSSAALDAIWEKLQSIADLFKKGFFDGLGDYETRLEDIKTKLGMIKDSILDIWNDPNVRTAASNWTDTTIYNLGRITGATASIGLTLRENVVGGLALYLQDNTDRIKSYLIDMFDISSDVMNMFGDLAVAIADIFEAFGSEDGQKITSNLIGIFADAVMGITELLMKFIRDFVEIFVTPIVDNSEKIKTAFQGILDFFAKVTTTIKELIDQIVDKLNDMYDKHIKPFMDSIADGLSELLSKFLDFWNNNVQPMLDRIADKIEQLYQEHIRPFVDKFIDCIGQIFDVLKTFWENILQPLIAWIIDNVLPILLPIVEQVVDTVIDAIGTIFDILGEFLDFISAVLTFLNDVFKGDWSAAWNDVADIFGAVWDLIVSIFKGAINIIIGVLNVLISGVEAAVNLIVTALNTLHFDVPNWVPLIGGKSLGFNIGSVSFGRIPYLAEGAVIPPNKEFLAVLGDQDSGTNIETPLQTMVDAFNAALDARDTSSNNGDIVIQIDGKEVFRAVRQQNKEYKNTTGKSAFA
jgi:predicted  nucleic acid-binding Zn-ribbon protein